MPPTRTQPAENTVARPGPDTCSATTDPRAPAGAKNSLGAKSDCNGRPTTDDSVVEAMDEQGPLVTPPASRRP
ncbi:MAG: hypothetical protein WB524_07600 [Acidobacteriaceae bacterium]|jgi:hypothetical protein